MERCALNESTKNEARPNVNANYHTTLSGNNLRRPHLCIYIDGTLPSHPICRSNDNKVGVARRKERRAALRATTVEATAGNIEVNAKKWTAAVFHPIKSNITLEIRWREVVGKHSKTNFCFGMIFLATTMVYMGLIYFGLEILLHICMVICLYFCQMFHDVFNRGNSFGILRVYPNRFDIIWHKSMNTCQGRSYPTWEFKNCAICHQAESTTDLAPWEIEEDQAFLCDQTILANLKPWKTQAEAH